MFSNLANEIATMDHLLASALQHKHITRENIDQLLDTGKIEIAMKHSKWWKIRRSGKTQTWKKDQMRIRIPYKMGLYSHGAIETSDFLLNGNLNPMFYRIATND
jgi:hypothetical protein